MAGEWARRHRVGRSLGAAGVALCVGLHAARAEEPSVTLPRYKLEPGLELTYRSVGQSDGDYVTNSTGTSVVTVLRQNDDGSYRVMVAGESSRTRPTQPEPEKDSTFTLYDVAPDGRGRAVEENPSTPDSCAFFPPLARSAQEASWTAPGFVGSVATYRPIERSTTQPASEFRMRSTTAGPECDIYGITSTNDYVIDLARGLMTHSELRLTQTYGFHSTSTGSTDLVSTRMRDAAEVKALADDVDRSIAAGKAYTSALPEDGDPAKGAAAKAALAQAIQSIATPLLRAPLERRLAQHDQMLQYWAESKAEREAVLNKPAPDWTLKDLDGKEHKLADLKGKVVVLDFWYRGCGWCVRAMPQMNELTEAMKDKPVAIFGINNDRDVNDAKFVAEHMKLAYPTLLGPDMPNAYGVHGFPTVVIIDREGVVRDVHVGYSTKLRQTLAESIEKCLKEDQSPGHH